MPGLAISSSFGVPWRSDGGNPGGFLALTYAEDNQYSAVMFPDLEARRGTKAFRFEADVRNGNPTDPQAANGFSVSFARAGDPVISGLANPGNFAGGAPESGTSTGVAVSFDMSPGGTLPDGPDVEGIIIRVDNITINRTALTTRNGSCDDNTSLQTGPRNVDFWVQGGDPRSPEAWASLCWKPFVLDLDATGKLTVTWKGRDILNKFQTTYYPSAGRFVIAGRTDIAANQNMHFDNVRITTVPVDSPIVGEPIVDATGFTVSIVDSGEIFPIQSTISLKVDGIAVAPAVSKTGSVTTLVFRTPAGQPYAPGSTHSVEVSFTDSNGKAALVTRVFAVPASSTKSIGVSFIGRDGGLGVSTILQRSELAGVVAQENWNNIDNSVAVPAEKGVSNPLLDSAGDVTAVELSYAANDSWMSDGPVVTPNDKLMKGIIKQQSGTGIATFYFTNLIAGSYDVYAYGAVNNGPANVEVSVGSTTKYWSQPEAFDGTFTESASAVAGFYAAGEYVKFAGVTPVSGAIPISAKHISLSDGVGIAGIQLVYSGNYRTNTKPVAITTQPVGKAIAVGENFTLFVAHSGTASSYRWLKDNVPLPTGTNSHLAISAATGGQTGSYTVEVKNNVNTVMSAAAVVTVNGPVLAEGMLKHEIWVNRTRAEVEAGLAGTPTRVSAIAGIELPDQGDNYTERVSGFFIPATTGQHVFFLNGDDDSDLFLSTDANPANRKLIAQEMGWSNSRQWNTPGGGGSTAEDKRSDRFPGSQWPTPKIITLAANQRYYLEMVHRGGGGENLLQLYIKRAEEPDPTNGAAPSYAGGKFGFFALPATVSFTTQPLSQSVLAGKNATLVVAASTTSEFGITAYQWRKNGAVIPGATSASYVLPVQTLADSGTKYSVDVLAPGAGTVSSAEAIITVVTDALPPTLLSAGSLKNFNGAWEVGIIFDEPLSPGSITALGNYTLNNGATVSSARLVTNSSGLSRFEQGIILTVNNLTTGNNYTLSVKGVADATGNAIVTPQAMSFTASAFGWVSIGDTVIDARNEAIAIGTSGFNLVNGGYAFWNTDDDITMVYEAISGDFDKQVQVEWNDPSSRWARAGISARESLNNGQGTTGPGGANPASRFQMVISGPETNRSAAGTSGQYETNRRLATGGAIDAPFFTGTPTYPDSWVRLKRVGQKFSMYYGFDGKSWSPLWTSDFSDPLSGQPPLPAQMFVGPTFGAENANIGEASRRGAFAARFRNYGNVPQKTRGKQTYAIGLNFGANEAGAQLGAADVAGAEWAAQSNWNNLFGSVGNTNGIVADSATGAGVATPVIVEWESPSTWASHGPRGEQNNGGLTGNNQVLMTGYLDTGNFTTTRIKVRNIPIDLRSAGYDVVIYTLGGVPERGGSYRVTDADGRSLTGDFVRAQGPTNPASLHQVAPNNAANVAPSGGYILFTNLNASYIVVEGSTEGTLADGITPRAYGGTPRAPINAVQLVTPSVGKAEPVPPVILQTTVSTSSGSNRPRIGERVDFVVTVQSSSPVNYQWFFNNVPISGATGAVYAIASASLQNQGEYAVEVSNAAGTVRSANIPLSILGAPVIQQVSVSTSTGGAPRVGDRVVFSVAAQSETAVTYQWLFNGGPIAGATGVDYEIPSVTLQQQGDYAVEVSNAAGMTRSGNTVLAVLSPPVIQQVSFATPGGGAPKAGDRIVFSVQVQSSLPVTHQWFFNNTAIAGATGGEYVIPSATAQSQGSYAVEVSSAWGTARSAAVALSFFVPPVVLQTSFTTTSGSATPGLGERVVFGVAVQSSAPVSYQWFFKNAPIPGGTTANFILQNVTLQNQGEYFVEVTNAGGTTRGAPVPLALRIDPPTVSAIALASPHGASPRLGDRIVLSVQASSSVTVTHQWFFGNAAIPGANGREFVIAAATRESQGDYAVEVANTAGTARSATLRVTLTIEPPVVSAVAISSPSGSSPVLGDAVTFSVQVTSPLPVTYQWFFNGAPIAGATNAQHVLAAATPLSQGDYAVEVTNADGTTRSAPAPLVVRTGGSGPQVLVRTIAGTNISGRVDATRGAEARFSYPNGLAHFGSGIVAVADGNNNAIRLIDRTGQTVTFAGANPPGHLDAAAALAQFNYPLGLRSDGVLDLIVADTSNNRIRKILSFGLRNVLTIAGSGRRGFKNGPAAQAEFDFVNDLVADEQGNIFVIEFNNNAVRKISADGVVSTVAGNGFPSYRDGPGPDARLNQPSGIEIDGNGNLYVTEWGNHTVRKITPEGLVSTLAGTNAAGFADGAGAAARFNRPDGITIDPMGNLYVTEHGNHAVRRIDPAGKVVTIAGLGIAGLRDGDRLSAQFNAPGGILWHPDGTLWVSDTDNHAIRRIEFLSSTNTGAAELLIALHPALTVFGAPGASYRIEAAETTNAGVPIEWHVVDTVRLSGEVYHWFDPQPASRKQRVYRAVKVE